MRTVGDGPSGTVTIPTSHGDGTVAVTIADGWSVELDMGSARYTWREFTEADEAEREMRWIALFAWTRKRHE